MPAKIILPSADIEAMRLLYRTGASCRDVAAAFGLKNKGTVRKLLIEAGENLDKSRSLSVKRVGKASPMRGRKQSPEAIAKRSMARTGKPGKTGHVFSAESRAKMRDTRLRLIAEDPSILEPMRRGAALQPRMDPAEAARRRKQRSAYKRLIRRLITGRKPARSVELLGYSRDEFIAHIERQFAPGMDWGPDMHIDHKVPVSVFLDHGVTEPRVVNALANLQPLPALANQRKSDTYPRARFMDDLALIRDSIT